MQSISKLMLSTLKYSNFVVALTILMLFLFNFTGIAQKPVQDDLFSPPATITTEGVPPIYLSEVKSLLYDSSALKSNLIWDVDQRGRKLLVTDESNDVYFVESSLARPIKLTQKSSPVTVKTNPSGKSFAYTFAVDRNDRYQLYLFDFADKAIRQLTKFTGDKAVESLVWSKDGKYIYYMLVDYESKQTQLCRHDLFSAESCYPVKLDGIWKVMDIKDNQILLKYRKSSSQGFLYLYDMQTNQLTPVDEGDCENGFFIKTQILWTTEGNPICDRTPCVLTMNLKNKHVKQAKLPENLLNLEDIKKSPNDKYLLIKESKDGINNLRLFAFKGGKITRELPPFISGAYVIWNARWLSDNEIVYTLEDVGKPASILSFNLKSKQITNWTREQVPAQLKDKIRDPQLIKWKTFDEKELTGFSVRPKIVPEKSPVLIYVHGGPQTSDTPVFSSQDIRLAANLGMTILHTNIRGSSGFGKEFMNADDKDKREDAVKDIQSLLDWVEKQPGLDANRIYLRGESYGGFIVLATALKEPVRVKGVIAEYPLVSIKGYLSQSWIDEYLKSEFGDPKDEMLMSKLDKLSPLNNVGKWNNIPLLLTRGKHDARTPEKDTTDLKNQLQKKGSPVWYIYSDDAGHGVNGKYVFAAIFEFLKSQMKE